MDMQRRFDANRLLALVVLFTALFFVLTIRLARLQLVQSEIYLRQSQTNRVRIVEKPPLRGLMYDRNGQLLVDNFPSYTLLAIPEMIDNNPGVRDSLIELTGISGEEFDRRLHKVAGNRYTPMRILRDIDFKLLASMEERRAHLPGIMFRVETKRAYPNPIAPQTLGHIGEMKEDQQDRYPDLRPGDIVGLSGLEERWNGELIGRTGYEYVEVDALGRAIGPLEGVEPIPAEAGSDLILTLDLELQRYAEELMGEMTGATVAIQAKTGEVLAIVSKPDYPPETFAGLLLPDEWAKLQADPQTPLLHRAVQGVYPPGSIFKPAVLTAGLASETINENWKITCVGGYQLGRRWFRCWNRGGHGEVEHNKSISQSCDVFYYLLGMRMGMDTFHDQIQRFGFGRRTGIDLPHESEGLLPSRSFMNRRYGEKKWTLGHMFNVSIGQGDVLVTPLQAAVFTNALANGGWWITPHLVKTIQRPDGSEQIPPVAERHETGFSHEYLDLVRQDMLDVIEKPLGTAHWLRDPRLKIAGKTGTAQNPQGPDHALFIAFAPFEDPEIAVAVVIEHGKHGSTAAAPIAFKLIRKYLGYDEITWQRYRWRILQKQRKLGQAEGPIE